jgi:hypothetical protein
LPPYSSPFEEYNQSGDESDLCQALASPSQNAII